MERKLNKKVEAYVTSFKEDIKEKSIELGLNKNENVNHLIQFIYDYDRLNFGKEDFMKRKRVKNIVPYFDRCCAKRANNEQCTRRKKEGNEYCGTHIKGSPHVIMDLQLDQTKSTIQKVEVWAQDIQGIIYYIDNIGNVYQAEDIVVNKMNPKIIAKYIKNDEIYTIPEFNLN
jgi:hypothetical protein